MPLSLVSFKVLIPVILLALILFLLPGHAQESDSRTGDIDSGTRLLPQKKCGRQESGHPRPVVNRGMSA